MSLEYQANCLSLGNQFSDFPHSLIDSNEYLSQDSVQKDTNLHNDQCVMMVVVVGSICCAGMVHCVRICLENVSLCHRCNHDRDYNDNVDEHEGSSQERDLDQWDMDEHEVVQVNYHEVCFVDDFDWLEVVDDLYLLVGLG